MLFDIDRQLWPKHSRVVSKGIEIEQVAGQFQGNKLIFAPLSAIQFHSPRPVHVPTRDNPKIADSAILGH